MSHTPPASVDAERAVLGSVLIDNGALTTIADFLRPDDFSRADHAAIFRAMLALYERRMPVDVVSLPDELERTGDLGRAGGHAAIVGLASATPTSVQAEQYARMVERTALLRRLITAGGRIAQIAYDAPADAQEAIDAATTELYAASEGKRGGTFHAIGDILQGTYDQLEALHGKHGQVTGVPSGLSDLDRLTGGFQPSDLIILAARPAVGKTSLALNVAEFAAQRGIPTAVFSLEMSREQLALRLLSGASHVDQSRLRTGVRDSDYDLIAEAMTNLSLMPLYIDDTAAPTITELRTRARRLQMEKGIALVVIDYLQLIKSRRKDGNRVNEVTDITAGLKGLARELHVPVLALSQLSRSPEHRDDHEPRLSDLRDSGSIEQDADLVLFLWPDANPDTLLVHMRLAKHRNGPTGDIDLTFRKEWTQFYQVAGRAA